jgi:predicted ATP-grasp superfamily ATP-dependent carboligase
LVAKPLTRQHQTWRPLAGAKALQLVNAADLRSLRDRLEDGDLDVLVQELVPGPESRIESYHVYIDDDGTIVGEFTGRKLRTHPPGFGYSTALRITDTEDVRVLGRSLCARMELTGVAKLDFKRDDDGHLRLLEVNPRFNLWHHPGALAGVNLPGLVHSDLTGQPRPAVGPARSGVQWCSLAHDHQAARADGVATLSWVRWAAACDAKSGFAWDDPLPLPGAALSRVGARLRRSAGA